MCRGRDRLGPVGPAPAELLATDQRQERPPRWPARSPPGWPARPTARRSTPPCCTRWPVHRRHRLVLRRGLGQLPGRAPRHPPGHDPRVRAAVPGAGRADRGAGPPSAGPSRCSARRTSPPGSGPPASPRSTCRCSRASRWAGPTSPATGSWPATSTTSCSTGPKRLAAVIGDVSGHGIEPSITAFQVKYLLRVFLRQYRDPAQALEELNAVISAQAADEEFVSMCVVVFDQTAGTLRYASAGHPPAWMWHDGEVRPLRSHRPHAHPRPQGLVLQPGGRPRAGRPADPLHRRAHRGPGRRPALRRGADRPAHPPRPPGGADVLCKSLLAAARDFATVPLRDDVAILAIRRT